ncbi:hypothetical protein NLU13_5228 [Sarocladium strictum]|uniref:Chorismate synthase protein n=1 Tax=Sarocladium strictum TaxID=5046 RepID=A0AA39L7K9_SARSR|nr:hypothetical protein NLU13_5228 [Sarocladium strictum]
MSISLTWDNIRALLVFFGPLLLPKAIGLYRSLRNSTTNLPIVPTPLPIRRALAVLLALAVANLAKTLPLFAPENLFSRTQSRLQVPVDVLFNRVASLRPNGTLTQLDQSLRARFVNLESRLLYLQFGPDVLGQCPFCSADEPKTYFYYALPAILWPHLLNLLVLSVITSSALTGRHGAAWRTMVTLAAFAIAALDVYLLSSYAYQLNARATRLADLDFFHWTLRILRHLSLTILDAGLGWILWLSSTNRAFAQLPSPAEQVENVNRGLRQSMGKLRALGILKNTTLRDEELRETSRRYWNHEVGIMAGAMEEREVVEGMNDALMNRIDIKRVTRDADAYSQEVIGPVRAAAMAAQQENDTGGVLS